MLQNLSPIPQALNNPLGTPTVDLMRLAFI